jgi:hypothetical protein
LKVWSRAAQALAPRVEYWNLKFIWNLVLGICDFRHKTPRQSQTSPTRPKGPNFSEQNKHLRWSVAILYSRLPCPLLKVIIDNGKIITPAVYPANRGQFL